MMLLTADAFFKQRYISRCRSVGAGADPRGLCCVRANVSNWSGEACCLDGINRHPWQHAVLGRELVGPAVSAAHRASGSLPRCREAGPLCA